MKVIILGAGLIGAPMAIDLAKENEFDVSVADIDRASLDKLQSHNIKLTETDLSVPETVHRIVSDFDYVINAVPGSLGFKTLRSIIEAGKNKLNLDQSIVKEYFDLLYCDLDGRKLKAMKVFFDSLFNQGILKEKPDIAFFAPQ